MAEAAITAREIQRRQKALDLRMAGKTYREIAAACEYADVATAFDAVEAELAAMRVHKTATALQLRDLATEQLVQTAGVLYSKIMAPRTPDKVRMAAAQRLVHVTARLARMWGLDAPESLFVGGSSDADTEAVTQAYLRFRAAVAALPAAGMEAGQ